MISDNYSITALNILIKRFGALPNSTKSELLAFFHAIEEATEITSEFSANETRFEIRMTAVLVRSH